MAATRYKTKSTGSPSLVIRTYSCNSGGEAEAHEFEVMLKSGENPKFCPVCGAQVSRTVKARPSKMSIGGSAIARSVDQTYRALETSSAERAAAVNNPNLKITNMRDRLREGDSAAYLPQNSVTNFMQMAAQRGLSYGYGGGAMGTPAFASSSPYPVPPNQITGAGHASLWAIQGEGGREHRASTAQAMVNGRVATDAPQRR